MHEKYEKLNKDENGNIKDVENFVFFYPRITENAKQYEASYLTKDSVFKNYFIKVFENSEEYKKLKEENEAKVNNESDEIRPIALNIMHLPPALMSLFPAGQS